MTTAPAIPVGPPVALAPRERRRHRAAPPPRSYGKPMAALALAGVAVATGSSPAVAADHKPTEPTSSTGQMPALSPALAAHAAAKARAAELAEQARAAEEARAAEQALHQAREAQREAQAAAAQAAQHAAQQTGTWAAWSSTTRPTPVVPAAASAPSPATQGDRTQPSLTSAGAPAPLLLLGSEGRRVAAWQSDLSTWRAAHGRSAIATDGSFGAATLNATVDFQRSTGVRVDGIVGPITNGAMSQQGGAATTTAAVASAPAQVTPAVDVRSTTDSGSRAQAVAATAQRYLGVPYVYGGASTAGFDCSGFTQYVFHQLGIDLPRTSAAQAGVGTAVSGSDARLGDLVFFHSGGHVYHVGIYLGGGRMVAAPKPGDRVKVESVYSSDVTYRRVV